VCGSRISGAGERASWIASEALETASRSPSGQGLSSASSNIPHVAALSTELPVHRLDAEHYCRIVDSGALDQQRVELIDGIIVQMSPHSEAHARIIRRLTKHLARAAGGSLSVQLPIQVAPDSLPEPDLALVDEPDSADRHPTSALLVVEVAASSHAIDRGRKAELYAAAGIPTYWLIDIPARAVEVRSSPGPAGYRTLHTLEAGDKLSSPCDGVAELAVDELFEGLLP
jgi:Uma2 family endonuclease